MVRESYSSREVRWYYWYSWDTISNRHLLLQSLVTQQNAVDIKNRFNFLKGFFFQPPLNTWQKKGHMATQSKPADVTGKMPNIFWVIWIEIFIPFPYANLWFCVFKSPTVRQKNKFHSSEQHVNTKTFGHLLLCFWWSGFSIYVQPGFHLFYICLTFFLITKNFKMFF